MRNQLSFYILATTMMLSLTACKPQPESTFVLQPAPLIDSSEYSFAIDIKIEDKNIVISDVKIVQGLARSYTLHPDQFRVTAKGSNSLPQIELKTYDPLWQRITLPYADKIIDQDNNLVIDEKQKQDKIVTGISASSESAPTQAIRETWQRRTATLDQYFIPFRPDIKTIEAGFTDGPQAKTFKVAQLVTEFCSKSPEYCGTKSGIE